MLKTWICKMFCIGILASSATAHDGHHELEDLATGHVLASEHIWFVAALTVIVMLAARVGRQRPHPGQD
ncbi:MAG: hypothetical protein V3W41_10620 [Planctomycetota bacterium]